MMNEQRSLAKGQMLFGLLSTKPSTQCLKCIVVCLLGREFIDRLKTSLSVMESVAETTIDTTYEKDCC